MLTNLKKITEYLEQQADIEFALLFGSQADGKANALSDIDIAVYLKSKKNSLEFADRQIDLISSLMKICRDNKADVVILNRANPFLRFQIVKRGRLLFAKDEKLFYHFKAATLGLYQDIKPMYDFYNALVEISLRRGLNG